MKPRNTIWVRNNGDFPLSSRFDGEDFTIEPGEYVEMEIACAELVFGLGEEDKTRSIRRLGWARTHDEMIQALKRLNSFSFHMSENEAAGHLSAPVGSPSNESSDSEKAVSKKRGPKPKGKKAVMARPTNALQKLGTVQPPAS